MNVARRALHRRRFSFSARPSWEVVAAGGGAWESVGSAPTVELIPGCRLLPTGWVWLDFEVEIEGTSGSPPVLYVDRDDRSEGRCIRLSPPDAGHVRTFIKLPAAARSLRFDPLGRPGRFRLGQLYMQEVSKLGLGLGLVALHSRRLVREPRRLTGAVTRMAAELRRNGIQGIKDRLVGKGLADGQADYAEWVKEFDTLHEADRAAIACRVRELAASPLLSIVMPVYNTPERWLRRAIDSVRAQLYPDWQLCIADDASSEPHVARVLAEYAERDRRIEVVTRTTNGHISEASNSALEGAKGDFVVLMDSDDEIPAHALYLVAEELVAHPETDLIYSDEDKIDEHGRRSTPYFKPDWNPDLFYSQNYFSHLGVYRRTLVRQVGGFRKAFDGSQDYDLALRCVAATRPERIRHIPHVLYHWRAIEGSGATDALAKSYAQPAAERALRDHFDSSGRLAEVSVARFPTTYRVRWRLPAEPPPVTVVVPAGGDRGVLERCVTSVLALTRYPRMDVVVVDDAPEAAEPVARLEESGLVRALRCGHPSSWPALVNFGTHHAAGEVFAFLHGDVEPTSLDWLAEMVSQALRREIGAVGAKLLYADDTVEQAGIVTGLLGPAGPMHRGLSREAPGYFRRAHLVHDVSAVSGACLVVRRRVFEEIAGFDEEHLAGAFADVDFCLRVEAAGYRNLWTPYAELRHHGSCRWDQLAQNDESRAAAAAYMARRWGARVQDDPYYSPNLSLRSGIPEIAWPPRARRPWRGAVRSHG